ncbi:hypothetical protein PR003_g20167 [Phytophthora rubi]|uniref:Uncharacterized protein n=1 Tax=Phytophthora rubi TaxID=129364 RepID=A0A6A3M3E8_9STRA|nr:hypothetical protein PR002_g22802 [Phytophthora rubi]KAE9022773.1 hypothetical protein PR001_g13071 [Phytophthora rubi]KAE9310846.1 hypothetical protein PR003_g20167 [Phytophthora rubi]
MKNAYVFRVTFENGTSSTGKLLDSDVPEFDVSYRMLYQLAKDRKPWMHFVDRLVESCPSLRLRIETVIEILATLEKIDDMKDMTVILCVDGLQQLVNNGTKTCAFYRVLATICNFLNSSRAFAVCVCSATVQCPVDRALSDSPQKRVYLLPPPLRGQEVLKPRTRLEKLLVDDMGGHGRALETLASVLRQYTKDELEQTDPASVLDQVCSQLRLQYGELFASPLFQDPANCQAVLAAILSRRCYCVFDWVVPDMTVDQLRSCGMFRLTRDGTLECAFVIFLMLLRTLPKTSGAVADFDEHLTRTMLGWPRFEEFVAFYRRVKSMVYWGTPVKLSTFHSGARFGPIHCILINELQPRTIEESTSQQVSRSGSGDSTRHDVVDVSEMGTIVINGASASAGDIFTRIQLTTAKKEIVCNEVIRCKLMQKNKKVDKTRYEDEKAKAVNDTDVFLLITSSDDVAEPFDLPERCGLVSKGEFDRYFGPFASRGHRSLQEPPNINTHELSLVDGVGAATAEKVIDGRRKRRFSSHDDVVSRLFPANKKCKPAEVLHALHCDDEEDGSNSVKLL